MIGSAAKGAACPPPKRPASAAAVSSRPSPSCAWRGCWARAGCSTRAASPRGCDPVDRVLLAGAFGSYLSPLHAMALGLIPDCDLSRVTAVGNAAGDGARIALLNRQARLEATRWARWGEHGHIYT